jgi:hypothetical protein
MPMVQKYMIPQILLYCYTLNDPKYFPPLQERFYVKFIYLIIHPMFSFHCIFKLQLLHQFIDVVVFLV